MSCNINISKYMITHTIQCSVYRIEFDAYRMDLENTKPEITQAASSLEETQRSYAHHKDLYEKLRGDVAVKMQFLDENRVSIFMCFIFIFLNFLLIDVAIQIKVMHKQLILLHNAIAAYFSGNAMALESTLKQFNIKVCFLINCILLKCCNSHFWFISS